MSRHHKKRRVTDDSDKGDASSLGSYQETLELAHASEQVKSKFLTFKVQLPFFNTWTLETRLFMEQNMYEFLYHLLRLFALM